jgi:selenocysteine lyase/cysteine desulfurase
LLAYGTEALSEIPGLKIIGQAREKISVISFRIEGIHHQDIGIILDTQGIAVRTGAPLHAAPDAAIRHSGNFPRLVCDV